MATVNLGSVRDLIAALSALPEDQKDLPVVFQTTVAVSQELTGLALGPADFGQQITLS